MLKAYSLIHSGETIIACDCVPRCNCTKDARAPRWARTRYRWDAVTRTITGIVHTGEDWTAPRKRGNHYLGCAATDPIEQHRGSCPCRYPLNSDEQENALIAITLNISHADLGGLETVDPSTLAN